MNATGIVFLPAVLSITTNTNMPTRFRSPAFVAALVCLPLAAQAANLGKLTVLSNSTQPLRAEIELSATPEELNGMSIRLATPETFQQAGIDYVSTLAGLRFSVGKRADGKSIIQLSSERPINDPFIDLLLEVGWPAGRVVREYTFLIDLPDVAGNAAAQLATIKVETPRSTKPAPAAPTAAPAPEAEAAAASKASTIAQRQVRRGETLSQIANETRYPGVSLNQMLVTLYRSNADAFTDNNMNRLRVGAILKVPERDAVNAVSANEAHKILAEQAQTWNAYRSKLAGAVADSAAKDSGSAQAASGKIAAKVEEIPAPAAEARDQVRIGKTEVGKDASHGKADAAAEEEFIAKDRALKEAQERIALLEQNVADMQKLVELKSQSLNAMQNQSAPTETERPQATKPDSGADTPLPPQQAKPAGGAILSSLSFADQVKSDPLPLAAPGAAAALLLGFFAIKRRNKH